MDKTDNKTPIDIVEKVVEPMDNKTILKYLPDAKILTTQDIKRYKDIDDIFDRHKYIDYVIILFLDTSNSGHWVALLKYGNIIEFFDSYGNTPKDVYNFAPKNIRRQLGTADDYLIKLINKSKYDAIYNPIKYQEDNKIKMDINTCGLHCCYRIIQFLGNGYTLPDYYKYMKKMKRQLKIPYDIIVADLIEK
jgi:hypothetical protein